MRKGNELTISSFFRKHKLNISTKSKTNPQNLFKPTPASQTSTAQLFSHLELIDIRNKNLICHLSSFPLFPLHFLFFLSIPLKKRIHIRIDPYSSIFASLHPSPNISLFPDFFDYFPIFFSPF